jgi:hypothetical protein
MRALEQAEQVVRAGRVDRYRELDAADIGDMELDPFARRYILEGF